MPQLLWRLLWLWGLGAAATATTGSTGSSRAASPTADLAAHARIGKLLDHAVEAAAYFVPARWQSAFPQPLSTVELLERWSYPAESWQVETADGHILMLHRIPQGAQGGAGPGPAPAVLLLHGMLCSSTEWLLAGPGRSLALQLFDAGFDVWLANFRGSPYSMGHRDVSALQASFWNYSFHEMGVQDLRAVLAEVRANAAGPVSVVGHSLGAAALLALLAECPECNADVLHAVLLAPIASLRGVASTSLRVLAHYGRLLGRLAQLLGVQRVLAFGGFAARLMTLACHPAALTADACRHLAFALAGSSPDLFDAELLPQILVQSAAGASVRTLVHLSECLVAEAFMRPVRDEAAEYNLTAVAVPLTLVYANNDVVSGPQESLWLYSRLRNVSAVYEVPHPTFNHIDFLYAVDVKRHLYDFVVEDVQKHARAATSWGKTAAGPKDRQGGGQGPTQTATTRGSSPAPTPATAQESAAATGDSLPASTPPSAATSTAPSTSPAPDGTPDQGRSQGSSLTATPGSQPLTPATGGPRGPQATTAVTARGPSATATAAAVAEGGQRGGAQDNVTPKGGPSSSTQGPQGGPQRGEQAPTQQPGRSPGAQRQQDDNPGGGAADDQGGGERAQPDGRMWNVGSWHSRGRSSEAESPTAAADAAAPTPPDVVPRTGADR